jgi:hypothetical protein
MKAEQTKSLYSELFYNLSLIVDDEEKLNQLVKYLRRLVKEKESSKKDL